VTGAAVPDRAGEAASKISTRVVALFKEYTGRGPTKCRTTIRDNLVVCVLEDTLTKAERKLADHGKGETVRSLRRDVQDTMEDDLRGVVESLTGRRVVAFMSANHIEPDYMAEVFVLEGGGAEASDGERLHGLPELEED
jgi:uncharacterized protein YbcI